MQLVDMVYVSEERVKKLFKPEDFVSIWEVYPDLKELIEEKKQHFL